MCINGIIFHRAESEMDIVFQTEVEPATKVHAKAQTPIKAPTPNPLKVSSGTPSTPPLFQTIVV